MTIRIRDRQRINTFTLFQSYPAEMRLSTDTRIEFEFKMLRPVFNKKFVSSGNKLWTVYKILISILLFFELS